jgi:hypothetical protein
MAAQAIHDRGYGKPHQTQSIDANITEDASPVRYYAEVPKPAKTTEEWLESCRPHIGRSLATGIAAAADDEQKH